MVKPDVKQNYYSDLDLPPTASIDDIRKAYRKLALQYHPDRNAGKEAECVPRFQAIQAASEVLSDPVMKAKYDQDRRKAGLYPTFKASGPVPTGNPYTASSAYPPPPRRTQPGTWQRPPSSTHAQQATGADRFTNFPRPGNAGPRRDPAAERTQQFRAWQHMNSAPDRHKYGQPPQPPPPPPRSPNPQAQPHPPQPQNTGRQRMQSQDTKMPTEEQIRAGMRHGKAPSQGESPAAEKQSAWQAFQTGNAGKPGMPGGPRKPRRAAPTTPRRPGGFDPNAPGSDERPAPTSTGHYFHRNRSDDMGKEGFPPPPPGPPPSTAPSSPTTTNARPFVDPLRPFRSREGEGEVPYAEGNRARTPYTSFIGEKTQFSSEGLRRSASTRDTNRSNPDSDQTSAARAKSFSPPLARKQADSTQAGSGTAGKPFPGMYSDSSESTEGSMEGDENGTSDVNDSDETYPDRPRTDPPDDAGPFQPPPRDRPIRKPKPPSSRLNGSNLPGSNVSSNAATSPQRGESSTAGAQSDVEPRSMRQRKSGTNMYANPSPFSNPLPRPFNREQWRKDAFGSDGTTHEATVPKWAVPSSVLPTTHRKKFNTVSSRAKGTVESLEQDTLWARVSGPVRAAYRDFREVLKSKCGSDTKQLYMLDLDVFLKLVSQACNGQSTGHADCDFAIQHALLANPSIRDVDARPQLADHMFSVNSFTFPIDKDTFPATSGKSRSTEDINTNFSPGGWSGEFKGTPHLENVPDYFGNRRPSPGRRTGNSRQGRPATMDIPSTSSEMPPPRRPDGPNSMYNSPSETKFSEEQWKNTFKDASWTWQANGAGSQPSSKTPSRKSSRLQPQTSADNVGTTGTKDHPHVVVDDEHVDHREASGTRGAGVDVDDAMDIDTPPPAGQANSVPRHSTLSATEPRLYSVPPSAWRQEQQKQQNKKSSDHRRSSTEPKLATNLDDLSHVEPLAKDAAGLQNLADMSSTLPFDSQAAPSVSEKSKEPDRLQMPPLPKVPDMPARLTKASWHTYALCFGNYLQHFHAFNKTMLAHVDARQKQAEARLLRGSRWLEAGGDTSDNQGFDSYLKGVREDEQVRETWNLGCERHLEAVNAFDKMRERVKKQAAIGALIDS
ncbi:Hypothetical predicted protein [Lecanosticta acicola]|uniref:J domain-containing protein n=1 Tax=Lecanosticta acicola TaxID=111012 RepID=A0AAI9E930_9PEZI|nr:Hypothetical predicted protein [Lecanosticta acicola]